MPERGKAFIVHNGDVIQEVSPEFLAMFKCTEENVIGKKVEEIIDGVDLRKLAVLRGKHIMQSKDDKEFRQDYDFIRCNDTVFWGEAYSVREPDGRYKTWVVWKYDVDEWNVKK